MTPGHYHKAAKAYQKKSDDNLSPLQIVVELYKGMIRNTKESKAHFQAGKLDLMTNSIMKTFTIIEALQANLDMEQGGEDAVFLNRFYNVVFSALTQATLKPDPAAEFDGIISYIQQVADKWYVLAYGAPSQPPPEQAAPAQV